MANEYKLTSFSSSKSNTDKKLSISPIFGIWVRTQYLYTQMGHLITKFKCIIYIQNVYILKQEVTGITAMEAGLTFIMAKR